MFSWIKKRRWKEANGLNTHPFGGLLVIFVILVGDVAQLPPVTDQVLHQNKPKNDMAVESYSSFKQLSSCMKMLELRAMTVNKTYLGNYRCE